MSEHELHERYGNVDEYGDMPTEAERIAWCAAVWGVLGPRHGLEKPQPLVEYAESLRRAQEQWLAERPSGSAS